MGRSKIKFVRKPFDRHCEHSEAIQPISMGAIFNNFIFRLIIIVTRQPISELALRLRSWIAAPLGAAPDDEGNDLQVVLFVRW